MDFLEFRLDLVKSLSKFYLRFERLDIFDDFALFCVVLVRGGLLLVLELLDTRSDLVGSTCVLWQSFDQLVTLDIKLSKFLFELLMLVKESLFGGVELLFFRDFLLEDLLVSVLAVLHFAALFDLLKLSVQGLLLGLKLFDGGLDSVCLFLHLLLGGARKHIFLLDQLWELGVLVHNDSLVLWARLVPVFVHP